MSKNALTILILLTASAAVFALGYYYLGARSPALRGAQVTVGAKTFQVEIASTTFEKARGLSGRDGLSDGTGMFFVFNVPSDYGFWMKDMKFPIDIIWIRSDSPSQVSPGETWEGEVVGFAQNAGPESRKSLLGLKIYYPPEPADRVLEVNAGDVKKYGIKVGDSVSFSGF
jgi:uncharacterized membrane protein (UPF0127 family)